MAIGTAGMLRFTVTLLVTLLVGLPGIWAALAIWYQAPGGQPLRVGAVVLWTAFSLATLIALWQGRAGMAVLAFAPAFGALLFWWQHIAPSNDRVWADDVARITSGTIEGNRATLHDVRNFDWRTNDDYTQRWGNPRHMISTNSIQST